MHDLVMRFGEPAYAVLCFLTIILLTNPKTGLKTASTLIFRQGR
jgi:hypothetical protein